MKARAALVVVGALALALHGCASYTVPGAEVTERGEIIFTATGTSVVAKEDDPLSQLEAEYAAATIAKAALLEKVSGAVLSGSVSVGDLMFESQDARVEVNGFLSRADIEILKPEATKLRLPPLVTAQATLRLSCDELRHIEKYVE